MPYLENGVSSAPKLCGNRSGAWPPFQIRCVLCGNSLHSLDIDDFVPETGKISDAHIGSETAQGTGRSEIRRIFSEMLFGSSAKSTEMLRRSAAKKRRIATSGTWWGPWHSVFPPFLQRFFMRRKFSGAQGAIFSQLLSRDFQYK